MVMSTFQKVTLATCLVLCVALLLPKMLLSRGRKDAAEGTGHLPPMMHRQLAPERPAGSGFSRAHNTEAIARAKGAGTGAGMGGKSNLAGQIIPVYGFGILLYILYILFKITSKGSSKPTENRFPSVRSENKKRKITDFELAQLQDKLQETELMMENIVSNVHHSPDRVKGVMADQEESLLQQLTEITRVMQEGKMVDDVAPQKKDQDWEGPTAFPEEPQTFWKHCCCQHGQQHHFPQAQTHGEGTQAEGTNPERTHGEGTQHERTHTEGTQHERTQHERTHGEGTNPERTHGEGTQHEGTHPERTHGEGTQHERTQHEGTHPERTHGEGTQHERTHGEGTNPERMHGEGTQHERTQHEGTHADGTDVENIPEDTTSGAEVEEAEVEEAEVEEAEVEEAEVEEAEVEEAEVEEAEVEEAEKVIKSELTAASKEAVDPESDFSGNESLDERKDKGGQIDLGVAEEDLAGVLQELEISLKMTSVMEQEKMEDLSRSTEAETSCSSVRRRNRRRRAKKASH